MSINAHRQVKVEFAGYISFNMGESDSLLSFLDEFTDISGSLNNQGGGNFTVPVSAIEGAIAGAGTLGLSAEVVEALKKDVAWAKRKHEDTLTYDCF